MLPPGHGWAGLTDRGETSLSGASGGLQLPLALPAAAFPFWRKPPP